ncbi:hypothetical protein [Caballeronia sordidicola]|uniref:hypothetical protein n=1 Tax=Caballeronia sordidicola TaxID=196367 RepID=UPI0015C58B81|nr:hypothetical protein [Caballeronia sordidicola]
MPDIPLNSQNGFVIYFAWAPNAGGRLFCIFIILFYAKSAHLNQHPVKAFHDVIPRRIRVILTCPRAHARKSNQTPRRLFAISQRHWSDLIFLKSRLMSWKPILNAVYRTV